MDFTMIVVFLGFILTGVVIAAPVAFALGQRSILKMSLRSRKEFFRGENDLWRR